MLCFVPVLHGCVWYACCYVGKKALLQCLQLLRGWIWAQYEVPLSVFLLGCGIGTMFLLRAVLNILVRNASPRGHICFRGLIFSELLFLLCFIASST